MKKVRFWVGLLLSLTVLTISTVVLLDKVIMPFVVGRNMVVTVPDVRGLSKEEVAFVLNKHHLRFKFAGQVDTVGVPPGTAVDQEPPPGMKVKEGREIRVTFARKPIMLTPPDTLIMPSDSDTVSSTDTTERPVSVNEEI